MNISLEAVRRFVVENFLVVGFSVAVVFSLSYPLPGQYMGSIIVGSWNIRLIQFFNNIMVFLISGLALQTINAKVLFDSGYMILYGIVTINFITTLVAFIMIRLPFPTTSYALGLTIFTTVPTTLGTTTLQSTTVLLQLTLTNRYRCGSSIDFAV